jgi:hypothetical protein
MVHEEGETEGQQITVATICYAIQERFSEEAGVVKLPSGGKVIVHAHFMGSTPPFDKIEVAGIRLHDIYAICVAPLGSRGNVYNRWYVDFEVWAELSEDDRYVYHPIPGMFASLCYEQVRSCDTSPTFMDVWHEVNSCTNGIAIITMPSGAMIQVEAARWPILNQEQQVEEHPCLNVIPFPRDAITEPSPYLYGGNLPKGEFVYLDPSVVGEGYSGFGAGHNIRVAILPKSLAIMILDQIENGGPEVWDSLVQL